MEGYRIRLLMVETRTVRACSEHSIREEITGLDRFSAAAVVPRGPIGTCSVTNSAMSPKRIACMLRFN